MYQFQQVARRQQAALQARMRDARLYGSPFYGTPSVSRAWPRTPLHSRYACFIRQYLIWGLSNAILLHRSNVSGDCERRAREENEGRPETQPEPVEMAQQIEPGEALQAVAANMRYLCVRQNFVILLNELFIFQLVPRCHRAQVHRDWNWIDLRLKIKWFFSNFKLSFFNLQI
jgi:hypothetical protein